MEAPLRARVDAGATRAGELGEELRTLGAAEVSLRQEHDDAARSTHGRGGRDRPHRRRGDRRDEAGSRRQARSSRRWATTRTSLLRACAARSAAGARSGRSTRSPARSTRREKERLTDLKTQREDLERSLEELDALCAELTATVERRFAETFRPSRSTSRRSPRRSSPAARAGSGSSSPRATEGELGVEVELRPAGKRITRLSLLSGGEKALGAISFLFALFLAKPCAFYLLDEVEAALDDTNIARFVELLRRYADRAQFVVVTHQKRTMEAADILYGVTMGPDGVSQVVSRRLPQHQQALAATA